VAIVRSYGALAKVEAATGTTTSYPSTWMLDVPKFATYAAIYRTQPSVRTVVDFLARNIAQLGYHVYRRVSDTDRVRLANHELADWIAHPNPAVTRYRLIESLMQDLGIYFTACWLKVRLPDRIGLVRLPPERVEVYGLLLPEMFAWTQIDGLRVPLDPSEVVYFSGYNPLSPIVSLSPLETLRQVLGELQASTAYRQAFWGNAAHVEGVIERPKDAPRWSADQKQAWREQWLARFSGPARAGQTAVLEDGMTYKQVSSTFRDSEFVAARKLSIEEVVRAYHVPLPMVGILDHATFSNVKEQHKQLYQDTLGPWLSYLEEELERQLLIDCTDQTEIYGEFNIAEKLKGSFEEQAASLQALCGRPIMTGNEGRARLNLPSMKDDPTMDEVVFSLNTASPSDASRGPSGAADAPAKPPAQPDSGATGAVIRRHWMRQRARLEKLPAEARAAAFAARWDRELAGELEPLYRAIGLAEAEAVRASAALAISVNADTLHLLARGEDAFSSAREAALYGR
jgi:HK97 family phage portal protein